MSQVVGASTVAFIKNAAAHAGLNHATLLPLADGRIMVLLGEDHTVRDTQNSILHFLRTLVKRCDTRVDILLEATAHTMLQQKETNLRGGWGDDSKDEEDAVLASVKRFSISEASATCDKVRFIYTDMRDKGAALHGMEEVTMWERSHAGSMGPQRRQHAFMHVRYTFESLAMFVYFLRKLLKCQFRRTEVGTLSRRVVDAVRQALQRRKALAKAVVRSFAPKVTTLKPEGFGHLRMAMLIMFQECTDLFTVAQLFRNIPQWAPVMVFIAGSYHTEFVAETLEAVKLGAQVAGPIRLPSLSSRSREPLSAAMEAVRS